MTNSLNLVSRGIPLTIGGSLRPCSTTTLSSDSFLPQLRRTPALELISELVGGCYQILTLPSGCWSPRLSETLEVSQPSIDAGPPSIESFELCNGATAILPNRSLPWAVSKEACSGEMEESAVLTMAEGSMKHLPYFKPAGQADLRIAQRARQEESLKDLVALCRETESKLSPQVAPVEEDLWLDLLRCAGPPKELPEPTATLVKSLVPSLRFLLRHHFDAGHISRALEAFVLWLEATHELEPTMLFGNDVFELEAFALPTLMVMVHADEPLEPFTIPSPAEVQFFSAIRTLEAHAPLGLTALQAFRTIQFGGVMAVRELGQLLMAARYRQKAH